MGNFALNHVTTAKASFAEFLAVAKATGCDGIELRNDLDSILFDGLTPETAAEMVSAHGLQLFALAEVKSFNQLTAQTVTDTEKLATIANACGAQAIALIPSNDGKRTDWSACNSDLKNSLTELAPILEDHNLYGFVEPLGFASASLRSKRQTVEVIEALGLRDRIKIVHDTFHHFIADEQEYFPDHTGMVHLSGVIDPDVSVTQMRDAHRVLVNSDDRLQSTDQLKALMEGGYVGPVSIEAFALEVHNHANPVEQLRDSFQFIGSDLAASAA